MDSKWPLKKARDFDLNVAENEPLDDDMHLGFNGTTNISQSHSNPSQLPITQNHYQNVDASYSQATNNFPRSSLLIPGYYDCLNQCFIPSTTGPLPPAGNNNYSMFGNLVRGSLGHDEDYHPFQAMQLLNSSSTPVRRCANCHTTDTPMWRRGPGGPKSLCNACGIKDRKERERKTAEESLINQRRS